MSLIREVHSSLLQLKQSKRDMKKFGFTMAIAFALVAVLLFFFGSHPERAIYLAGIAIVFLLFGFLLPSILKPFFIFWMGLAFVLGYFMSRLLLTLLFFLVITPIGFIMHVFGKDILDEKIEYDRESYWIKREKRETPANQYERLF